ncbi:hypothetical protein R6Q59_035759 [Mikania micrantha]
MVAVRWFFHLYSSSLSIICRFRSISPTSVSSSRDMLGSLVVGVYLDEYSGAVVVERLKSLILDLGWCLGRKIIRSD